MDREEIIQRLKNISEHAVHTVGKQRYIMSLDDGIALCEAAEILEREPSVIDSVLEIIDKVIEGQMKQAETFNGNGCHSLAKTHQDQACGAQIAKKAILRLKEGG